MDATILAAAGCAAKCCPPHAIAAIAVAFAVGFVAGRLTKRGAAKKARPQADARKKQFRAARAPETPRQPVPAGSVEIYVGNLNYDLTEDGLKKLFAEYGEVASARIVTNRFNGKSKGFGCVVMPNRPEAEKAIEAYSEKDYMGRRMRVNEAKNTING